METCIFSSLESVVDRLPHHDGKLFTVSYQNETLKYGFANDVLSTYETATEGRWLLSPVEKLKALYQIIDLNDRGLIPIFVWDTKTVTGQDNFNSLELEIIRKNEFDHKLKESLILKMLSKKLKDTSPFTPTGFKLFDLYRLNILNCQELETWLYSLKDKNCLEFNRPLSTSIVASMTEEARRKSLLIPDLLKLTSDGWKKIYNDAINENSRNVFIAMAFTDNEERAVSPSIRDTIKNVCTTLKWNPTLVDETGYNDGVMDKVITLINESRFVIAELTHHKLGVYYEAGYAKAKGLEVIHCVQKSHMGKCHFDVKHLNLIIWETEQELEEKLTYRITSTLGRYIER